MLEAPSHPLDPLAERDYTVRVPVPSELFAAVPAARWRALLAPFAPWQRIPAKATASSLAGALDEALVDSRSAAPLARGRSPTRWAPRTR